jgi:hypothetical protein
MIGMKDPVNARRTRLMLGLALPLVVAVSACDIIGADFKSQATEEWRKSYELSAGGRIEIANVNGKVDVEPASDNRVEVVAMKIAKGSSPDAAKQLLGRIEIKESASPDLVKIETKLPSGSGMFSMGGYEVRYTVKVPPSAEGRYTTINGGVDLLGLSGRVIAATTNGGVRARDISGPFEGSTTNGGVELDLLRVVEGGVKLESTNGGFKVRVPADARASISASISNGGIDVDGLNLDTTESSRQRLEAKLNGGGPWIRIEGTNGGVRLSAR